MDKFLTIVKKFPSWEVELKIPIAVRACERSFIFIIFKSIWLIDSPCLDTHISIGGSYNTPKWYNTKYWNLKMSLKAILTEVNITTVDSESEYYLIY